ncbi:hypothetical protein [Methylocella sp.]|uniref:hypothetical protein n=1 Tax=Methylocella sp. TaxID=1978226 RepID=UPI003C282B17
MIAQRRAGHLRGWIFSKGDDRLNSGEPAIRSGAPEQGIDHAEKYRIEGGSKFESRSIPQVDFAIPQVDFAIFQVDLAKGIEDDPPFRCSFAGATGENRDVGACAGGRHRREPTRTGRRRRLDRSVAHEKGA